MYLFFVVCGVGGKNKDTCYWRMPVNRGVGDEHVFIFCGWFGDYRIKKDTGYYVCY